MCRTPLHILNPIKRFNPYIDKKWLDVPCGHCWQCRQNKRNDMFVRSYFEHMKCEQNNGYSVFFTLTYSNDYLPTISSLNIPCFDGNHITKYMKRLRMRLHRICKKYHYGSVIDGKFIPVTDGNITYQINGEYGSRTHRPHYHCLFHINTNFPRYLFLQEAKKAWDDMGFTYSSKHNSGIINGIGALKYVSKYITKDFMCDDYLEQVKNIVQSEISFTKEERTKILEVVKPLHRHSKYYGVYGVNQFMTDYQKEKLHMQNCKPAVNQSEDQIMHCQILVPDEKEGMKVYKLPLYFQRFLFYRTELEKNILPDDADFDKKKRAHKVIIDGKELFEELTPKYVLNEKGRLSRQMRLDDFLKACSEQFKYLIGSKPKHETECLEFITKRTGVPFTNYEEFKDALLRYSDNISSDFLDWNFYYRGYLDTISPMPCDLESFLTCRETYLSKLHFDRFINVETDFPFDEVAQGCDFSTIFDEIAKQIHNCLSKHRTFIYAFQLFNILLAYYQNCQESLSYKREYDWYQNKLLKNPT